MKLRIKGNSLRLRLTRTEVSRLAAEGALVEETDFGNQTFRFSVATRGGAEPLSCRCEMHSIEVTAPEATVARWAANNEVGIYGEQPTSQGGVLTIALEKDFRCLDPRRDEDESDHFDNPLAGQSQHTACENAVD